MGVLDIELDSYLRSDKVFFQSLAEELSGGAAQSGVSKSSATRSAYDPVGDFSHEEAKAVDLGIKNVRSVSNNTYMANARTVTIRIA